MATRSWIAADVERPISHGAAVGEQLGRLWRWLAACRRRAAERRELRELDEHALRDLRPKRVREEAAKPFWVE